MSDASPDIATGRKVTHPQLGEGVVLGVEPTGFLRVFFQGVGERQVPADALTDAMTWTQRVLAGMKPVTPEALERLYMARHDADLGKGGPAAAPGGAGAQGVQRRAAKVSRGR